MRGFTLVETLIYIAIMTLVTTSCISFSFMLFDIQTKHKQSVETELEGLHKLYVLKNELLQIATSSGVHSIDFSIGNHEFHEDVYIQ
jgi:hypothetical protein